ncbi:MAG: hypothetical protein KGL10_09895, partial [Alphaproteobacteria bacterium]|nr:hypothetical protein [Alphaproteobacteria bacterium]
AIAAVAVLFGDEERIYLRLNGTEEESETQQCIAAYLEEKGYRITDYGGGYATDAAGRQQFRIGKLLKGEADLYAAFCNDSSRTLGRLLVVVSRNAMDIALMSTGRAWSSCMGSGGFNWPYVPRDVSEGALVTYLISEKDPDILNPLARILLLPFREKMKKPGLLARAAQKVFGRKSAEAAPQQIYLANKAYGLHNESFIKTVDDFVESTFNGGKTGRFFIADGLYPDMLTHIVVRKKPRVPRPQ